MCKFSLKSGDTRIDPCMREIVNQLNDRDIKVVMCCCGHGKYPPSIIVENDEDYVTELFSGLNFDIKKKRFYKRDKQGHYYIPEVDDWR